MVIQENMHYAKTHFSELIKRSLAGDQVVIAKSGKPLVKLVPFCENSKKRVPGSAKNQVTMKPNFNDPLPPDELAGWGL